MMSQTPQLLLVGGTDDDAGWVHRALATENRAVRLERVAADDDPRPALSSTRFDAILIDLYSSKVDAEGWVRLLQDVGRRVPLVVVADARQEQEVFAWLAAGASSWVFRPGLLGLSAVLARLQREAREEAASEEKERLLRNATAGLVELTRAPISRDSDLTLKFREVNRRCVQVLGVDRCGVWLYNEDKSELLLSDAFDTRTGSHSEGTRLLRVHHPKYFEALSSTRVIAASHAQTDPRMREFAGTSLEIQNIVSTIDVALILRGELVGALCMGHRGAPRRWTAAEEVFATAVADVVSLSLEVADRLRVESALASSERRFRDMFEYSPDDILVYRVSAEGRFFCEDANPSFSRSRGLARDDVLGREPQELPVPYLLKLFELRAQQAISSRAPVVVEHEYALLRERRLCNTAFIPMLDDTGRVHRLSTVSRDVTSVSRDVTALAVTPRPAQELAAQSSESGHPLGRLGANPHESAKDEVMAAVAHRTETLDQRRLKGELAVEQAPAPRHLMLVDDHPGMARVSAKLLETIGYRTSVFDDPRTALEAFRKQPAGFDAVLTDLSMPQMSGEDFTRLLHEVRPNLPIIVSSGMASPLDDFRHIGVTAVLVKPWRLDEAAATLDRVFANR